MKLYTEEQIKKVIKDSFLEGIERNTNYESVKKSILNSLTPIKLPSDEEIEEESLKTDFDETFRNGAKWLRDKIGGNNDQQ